MIAREIRTIMPRRHRIRKISAISKTPATSTASPNDFNCVIPSKRRQTSISARISTAFWRIAVSDGRKNSRSTFAQAVAAPTMQMNTMYGARMGNSSNAVFQRPGSSVRAISHDGTPSTTASAVSSSVSHSRMVEKRSRARSTPSFSSDSDRIGTIALPSSPSPRMRRNVLAQVSASVQPDISAPPPMTYAVSCSRTSPRMRLIRVDIARLRELLKKRFLEAV